MDWQCAYTLLPREIYWDPTIDRVFPIITFSCRIDDEAKFAIVKGLKFEVQIHMLCQHYVTTLAAAIKELLFTHMPLVVRGPHILEVEQTSELLSASQ